MAETEKIDVLVLSAEVKDSKFNWGNGKYVALKVFVESTGEVITKNINKESVVENPPKKGDVLQAKVSYKPVYSF